ncbi:MAG TPA: hypothetical protein VFV50_17530 [Bdellovibrionales bacterium]|nr:hypothetical protein [Bdellovibrionales bacterium]
MTDETEKKEEPKIPPFFHPQKIGGSLREVDVSLIQSENENVVSRWFHGPHDADLFIWTDERNNVIKHQTSFCGQIVEWNVLDGIRTGFVLEQETASPSMGASETIKFDARPMESAIHQAHELIRHVDSLDEVTRRELLQQLTQRPSFSTMKPEEILKRYGGSSRDGVWRRFKEIFRRAIGRGS